MFVDFGYLAYRMKTVVNVQGEHFQILVKVRYFYFLDIIDILSILKLKYLTEIVKNNGVLSIRPQSY